MAVGVDYARLERDLPPDARLVLDTSAVIAYLVGDEIASGAATWLFDGRIGQGRNPAILSAVTAAELLVGPFKRGRSAVATAEGFLQFFGEILIAPMDYAVARRCARIRADTGLAIPDAVVLATAMEHEAGIVVTNDRRWVAAAETTPLPVKVCLLASYALPG